MTGRLLEELITELIGEDSLKLVKLVRNKLNISEFLIADKLKISINQVRNILYRLQNYSLVTFNRKKDKKKGWYIYYWTFDTKRARELLLELKKNKLERLKKRLERELQNSFFVCPNSCIRMDEDTGMGYEFKCQECGEILVKEDNSKIIEHIKKEIKILENELKEKEIKKRRVKRIKRKKIKPRKIGKKKITKKVKRIKKNVKKVKKKGKLKGKKRLRKR